MKGLVALYEQGAILACGDGKEFVGVDQIGKYFVDFLASRLRLSSSDQARALRSGDLALTSSRLDNHDITAEIARRQTDGNGLWVVDQFAIGKSTI